MINKKRLIFLRKNGYLIKKTNDQVSLDSLQDFVYKIFSSKKIILKIKGIFHFFT